VADRSRIPPFVNGLPQTEQAIEYAERMHAGQQRADGTPFILHPREVAALLYYAGAPDHLIAAGVMHDLVEKTNATASDLRQRFGQRITELVLAVSDDARIAGYTKRKAAPRQQVAGAGQEALTLFAADKLSKTREPRREAAIDSAATSTRVASASCVRAGCGTIGARSRCSRNASPDRRSSQRSAANSPHSNANARASPWGFSS
jgi:hypothetical protein